MGEEEKNNNKKKARKVVREKVTEPQVIAKEGIDTLNQIGKETTQSVEQLHNIIKKTAKYEKNPQKNNNNINDKEKINFYELINDPLDFGQTIENLFHLSFLVKDGHVKFLDDNQTPSISSFLLLFIINQLILLFFYLIYLILFIYFINYFFLQYKIEIIFRMTTIKK